MMTYIIVSAVYMAALYLGAAVFVIDAAQK